MILYRYAIRGLLMLRYLFHRLSATGGFGPGPAVPVVPSPERACGQSLTDGLWRHHVKQFHESSCSVASVVSVINALLEKKSGPLSAPVSQKEILDRVREAHWKERMGPDGYRGKRGLPLEVLGRVVRASLLEYGIDRARVEVIRMRGGKNRAREKERLLSHLQDFQAEDKSLIIAHFDQGTFLKELNIPHISPVGRFDPKTREVVILDVDAEVALPYRIPFFRFYRGIATHYGGFFTPFDYGRGGYVRITTV